MSTNYKYSDEELAYFFNYCDLHLTNKVFRYLHKVYIKYCIKESVDDVSSRITNDNFKNKLLLYKVLTKDDEEYPYKLLLNDNMCERFKCINDSMLKELSDMLHTTITKEDIEFI